MPWIAQMTCQRVTSANVTANEFGRHRRGEIISIRAVPAIPLPGTEFTQPVHCYIHVTDIPDARTLMALQERFSRLHQVTDNGFLGYRLTNNPFGIGEVVTDSVTGATGIIDARFDDKNTFALSGITGKFEIGNPITSPSGGAATVTEFIGTPLGRKKVFIAVSNLTAPRRRRAWIDTHPTYQGWDDVSWNVFRNNWLKRRPANTPPISSGNSADDDADDAAGVPEII